MPTFVMGNGGTFTIGTNSMSVKKWTLSKKNRIAETTHSGSNGWATRQKTVAEADGTAEILWDSTLTTENAGLDQGDTGNLDLKVGASALVYTDIPIIVESFTMDVDQETGLVKYTVNWLSNGTVPDPA